jgi:hypothetical protein
MDAAQCEAQQTNDPSVLMHDAEKGFFHASLTKAIIVFIYCSSLLKLKTEDLITVHFYIILLTLASLTVAETDSQATTNYFEVLYCEVRSTSVVLRRLGPRPRRSTPDGRTDGRLRPVDGESFVVLK